MGVLQKKEIYPHGVFTTTYNPNRTVRTPTTYNPNRTVRTPRGSNNTTRPKKQKGKPPPPINAQKERAERKAAERNLNRLPHQRLRGGSRTRKRRYF
jgi:hypothetical protein